MLQSSLIACNRIKSCSEGKFDQKEHDQLRFSNRDDRGRNHDSVNVVLRTNCYEETGVVNFGFNDASYEHEVSDLYSAKISQENQGATNKVSKVK